MTFVKPQRTQEHDRSIRREHVHLDDVEWAAAAVRSAPPPSLALLPSPAAGQRRRCEVSGHDAETQPDLAEPSAPPSIAWGSPGYWTTSSFRR
jgi:hypothetical protein